MNDLKIIIDSLGEQNEEIEDDKLADIEEEIDSIDEEEYFELAKRVIKLGKPQILEYLVKNYVFNQTEIKELCDEIKKFEKQQHKLAEDSDDDEDIDEIMKEYVSIIKSASKLPYRKTKKHQLR